MEENYVPKLSFLKSDNVKWTSTDSNVASVSSEGKVITKSVGEVSISAKIENGKVEVFSFLVR